MSNESIFEEIKDLNKKIKKAKKEKKSTKSLEKQLKQVKDKKNWSMALPLIGHLPSMQSVNDE